MVISDNQPTSLTPCLIKNTHPENLQEQERKTRVKGIEAVKSNIQAAKAVSRVLRTSLGPKGMDKLLQSPDGDIVISEFLFVATASHILLPFYDSTNSTY